MIAVGGTCVACLALVYTMHGFAYPSGAASPLNLPISTPIAAKYVCGLVGEEIASATENFAVLPRQSKTILDLRAAEMLEVEML